MKSVLLFLAVVAVVSEFCESVASLKAKRAVNIQNPLPAAALSQLRGRSKLSVPDEYNLIATARAGQDYLYLSAIPQTKFNCSSTHQPGFHVDTSPESRYQFFHRCDTNGNLCPNMSVFNSITLTCSWFFDVDCSKAASFDDYSNSRLYQGANVPLLDDVVRKITGAVASGRVVVAAPVEAAAEPAPDAAAEGEAPAE